MGRIKKDGVLRVGRRRGRLRRQGADESKAKQAKG
jgi:hypothetical protein